MRPNVRSTRDRLLDIKDAIGKARTAVGEMSFQSFEENWLIQFAAERAIEIISEASRHIPDALKATEQQTPWRDIADIGNILRHVYDKSDPEIVWRVVKFDLDPLEAAIDAILLRIGEEG